MRTPLQGICIFLTLTLGLAWTATPVTAQPPVPDVCDQTDSGDRIKCKFNNVIQQQRGMVETIDQLGIVPPAQRQAMMKEVDRAGRAHGRAAAIEFKNLTRKSRVACQIKEAIGDGQGDEDGLCTGGEACEEVRGDQIGDDDGICHPRNGNNREVCVEICDADAVNANPENFDDDPLADSRGRDLEEALDDMTGQYEGITMLMQQEFDALSAGPATALATGACAAVMQQRVSTSLLAVLGGAADGLRMTADVSERFCDQAAFGFSGSSVCAIVEGVAGLSRLVADAFAFGDGTIDSETIDAIWACLRQTSETTAAAVGAVDGVSADLTAVNLAVSGVDERVVTLDGKVEALAAQVLLVQQRLNEVAALLRTPFGRRNIAPAR